MGASLRSPPATIFDASVSPNRGFATEMVYQIYDDFVQLPEQFLNLIVGCLMRILLLVTTLPVVAF